MRNVNLIIGGKVVAPEQLKNSKEVGRMLKQAVGVKDSIAETFGDEVKHARQSVNSLSKDKFEKRCKLDFLNEIAAKPYNENAYVIPKESYKFNVEKCKKSIEEDFQDIASLLNKS